jgi:hypothetical protein
MESLKKHGDPLEVEIRPDPVRGSDDVGKNKPGSKGEKVVRSADQKPNPDRPSDDGTLEPGGDLGRKRTTL